jgi:thiol:disulfide interchange protein DsbD
MMTKKICLKISLALLLLSIGVEGYTQGYQKEEEIPANPMHLSAQIMTTPNSNRRLLAVSFFNLEHWHSYWQNPGDAGLPIKATFTIASNGAAATVNTLELPSPQRFIEPGNMWAYGHEGEYTYFYEPASNINQPMRAEITWLICKNICIPGKATLDIPWPTGAEITISPAIIAKKPLANTELEKRFASLPKTVNFPESMTMQLVANSSGEQPLALYYEMTGVNPSQLPINRNFLTPFQLAPFDFNHEELFWDGNNKLVGRILVGWDGQYQEPEIPLPADGAFKKPFILNFAFFNPLNGETHYISKTFNHFVLKTDLHQRISALKPIAIEDLQKKSASVGA